jgi:ABC-type Fe3+-siderophore transport system permease subunit
VLVLLTALASLVVGALFLTPAVVLATLTGEGDDIVRRVIFELRLPRTLVGGLCGAMFAASGAMLQGIVRNPLASPDIVGISAGAGLAAVILLLLVPEAPASALPLGALAGAWLGFALVYALARVGGAVSPLRLALVGIAVAASLTAAQQLVLVRAPDSVAAGLSFLAGSVYGADWDRLTRLLPWAAVLLPASLFLSRRLDVLALGDDLARGLGQNVESERRLALLVAVALAAAATSGVGVLGFVGLVAPHASRLLVGPRHGSLLPASMLFGFVLVVAADALGRALLPPLEVPAGILTTLLGAPYFLFLLKRQGRLGA